MDNVKPLFAASTLAHDNAGVSRNLRELADAIDAGAHGEVETCICLMEAESDIKRIIFGRPLDRARACGLIHMAGVQAATD